MLDIIEALRQKTHLKIAKFMVKERQCTTIDEALSIIKQNSQDVYNEWVAYNKKYKETGIYPENPLS